jgi:hypothetical protein
MRPGALIAGAVLLPVAVVVSAQEPAAYYSQWFEAQDALRAFANVELSAAAAADPLPAYRREAARHARAIGLLGRTLPPPEAAFHHWRIVPLHERAQAAMSVIVGGMERGDPGAVSAGRSAFGDALRALERELRERE